MQSKPWLLLVVIVAVTTSILDLSFLKSILHYLTKNIYYDSVGISIYIFENKNAYISNWIC